MSTGLNALIRFKRLFSSSLSVMLLVWIIAIVGAGILYHFTAQQAANRDATDQGKVVAASATTPSETAGRPTASHDSNCKSSAAPPTPEAIARTKLRWVRVKGQIEELRDSLRPATTDVETWTTLLKQLSENDAGKRIAGDKKYVDQYRALLEHPRKPARSAEEYRDSIQIHLEAVDKCLNNAENMTQPSDAMAKDLEQLQNGIQALTKEYHTDRIALEKIVSDTAKMSPSQLTLAKAIEEREKEIAGEYLAQLDAVKKKADDEGQRKIREAEDKAIREKAQAKAARLISETKDEEARKNREAEAKRLKALAEDPEIQKTYSAFLQKGYMQLTCTPSGGQPSKTDRPRSVSYNDLSRHGWLKNVETFARAMARQPSRDYFIYNDRPTHPYPHTQEEWEDMESHLKQFKELAPIWIEMKLLEP
jgi:hypothetical protein